MQKYDFHFAKQLFAWIFRGFTTKTKAKAKTGLKLHEAIGTQKVLKFGYLKDSTGEVREAVGKELRYNKAGNVLYYDIEAQGIRSFIPANLKTLFNII